MENIFEKASRLKVRFDTPQGQLSVEDLWNLPLSSSRVNTANLDSIAIALNKHLQDIGTVSFVKKTSSTNKLLKLKLDIVLYVINVLQVESEASENSRINIEKKQQLLSLIANKETEELGSKSIDELKAMAAAL